MESVWRVAGVSVQGTSHQKSGMPCQDAWGYWLSPNGVVLIAIADGAGSAERSQEGARCAVVGVLDALSIALTDPARVPPDEAGWTDLLVHAFQQAQQSVIQLAESEGTPLRAFAATLTCALASDEGLVVGQIGDGVAVAALEDGQLFAAAPPQRGEYANETLFLTHDEALQRLDIRIYPQPVRALIVMTDGLIRLAMDLTRNAPHLPFFKPLLEFAAEVADEAEAQSQLESFLASERVCARTDDDKTLVLALRPILSTSLST